MDVSAMYTEVFTCCHRQNHHDFLHPTKESSPSSPVPTSTVFAVVTFKLSQSLQGGDGKCRRSELCVHWFPSAFPSSFLLYFIHWSMILCAPALPEVTCSVPGCRCLGFSPSGFITEHTVPPSALLLRPCQVCLITSVKSKFLERANGKSF